MPKSQKKIAPGQATLFDLFHAAREMASDQGSLSHQGSLEFDAALRAAISSDIKASPLSRYQIAARMSELIGSEISETQLNSWTAESHQKHRFPATYLPAFIRATGGQRRAFEIIADYAGLLVLPGADALRVEINRLDEEIERLKSERAKRKIFLKEAGDR